MNTVLLIDDILPAGDYATSETINPPTDSVSEAPEDVLKMLERQYMRYLLAGDTREMSGSYATSTTRQYIKSDEQPAGESKTLTEYLLGEGRMIDKLLAQPEPLADTEALLSEPPTQELLHRLSPLELSGFPRKKHGPAAPVDSCAAPPDVL